MHTTAWTLVIQNKTEGLDPALWIDFVNYMRIEILKQPNQMVEFNRFITELKDPNSSACK